jgi:hypothetical protein
MDMFMIKSKTNFDEKEHGYYNIVLFQNKNSTQYESLILFSNHC